MASHHWRSTSFGVGTLTVALCLSIVSANATVKPGDTIAPSNVAQVKELVSPGVYYAVAKGMRMSIVPNERVGPTLFVGYAFLSDNGNLLNIALGVVANYLTEFFRGAGKAPTIKLDFIVEKTPSREYKHLKFEGPPEAILALREAVQAIRDE